MKFLVTGGGGFIGSHLIERLKKDHEVMALDIAVHNRIRGVHYKEVDICDRRAIPYLESADTIVHMASLAGVDRIRSHPVRTMEVTLNGTQNVLKVAKNHGQKVVFLSTSEVFGAHCFNLGEDQNTALGAVGEPRWTYAASKLAAEHLGISYYKEYFVPFVGIRPFNIFGPRQVGQGAIHDFIVRALNGDTLNIYNGGSQIRSWCYIDDFIDGLELAIFNDKAAGNVFNIGNPANTATIDTLARTIKRLTKSHSEIWVNHKCYTDVELRLPSINKAKDILGFSPKIDLEDGLKRTIRFYRGKRASIPATEAADTSCSTASLG